MIRIATPEDYNAVFDMSIKFAEESPYKAIYDKDVVGSIVMNFLEADNSEKIIIVDVEENVLRGFIAAAVTPFVFGTIKAATEVAWWVDSDFRKAGVGDALIEAFEFWADKVNCEVKTLAFMDKDLSKYMQKKGYVPYETVHYKMN